MKRQRNTEFHQLTLDLFQKSNNLKHVLLKFTLLMILVACARQAEAQKASSDFVPVTDSMLQNPDPDDWLMWRRTLDSWGYSPLNQVDRENVSELRRVWSQALVQEGSSQQGTPLVYDGVMYMPNPRDVTRALNAATGERIWEYRRKWPEDLTTYLRDPGRTRNQAIYGKLIIGTSGDDFVFAIDGDIVAGHNALIFPTETERHGCAGTIKRYRFPILAVG